MALFASVLSANDEIIDVDSMPLEEIKYITIRCDSIPAPAPVPIIVYPIEDFIRIEEGAK